MEIDNGAREPSKWENDYRKVSECDKTQMDLWGDGRVVRGSVGSGAQSEPNAYKFKMYEYHYIYIWCFGLWKNNREDVVLPPASCAMLNFIYILFKKKSYI